MPPSENSDKATILFLSRILAALAHKLPRNEIRIRQSLFNQIRGNGREYAVFEDFDRKTDEILLTFRPKSLATYLIEEPCPNPAPSQSVISKPESISASMPSSSTANGGRLPLSDAQIIMIENRMARERRLRQIRQQPQPSSNPLDGIL